MITAKELTLCYRVANDRMSGIKEYLLTRLKGKIEYRELCALCDVSFDIHKGEVVGIIGNNGAGKSTLLKIIAGILRPTRGILQIRGRVVPMLELGSGFDYDLTGRENVFLNGAILGYSEAFLKEKYPDIVAFSGLGDFMETPVRNYSSGMVMRLAFSIASLVDPDILIVDEILSVGDATFQKKSYARMRELMAHGTTVLLVSHSLEQIRDLCHRVIWLDKGRLVAFGDTEDICEQYTASNRLS